MTIEKLQKSNDIYSRLHVVEGIVENWKHLTHLSDMDGRCGYTIPNEVRDKMCQYFLDYKDKLEEEFAKL